MVNVHDSPDLVPSSQETSVFWKINKQVSESVRSILDMKWVIQKWGISVQFLTEHGYPKIEWVSESERVSLDEYILMLLQSRWKVSSREEITADLAFEIFDEMENYVARKHMFEHYIDEVFESYKYFNKLHYTFKVGLVFRYFASNMGSKAALDQIKAVTQNIHEVELIFHLLYHKINLPNAGDTGNILEDTLQNFVELKDRWKSNIWSRVKHRNWLTKWTTKSISNAIESLYVLSLQTSTDRTDFLDEITQWGLKKYTKVRSKLLTNEVVKDDSHIDGIISLLSEYLSADISAIPSEEEIETKEQSWDLNTGKTAYTIKKWLRAIIPSFKESWTRRWINKKMIERRRKFTYAQQWRSLKNIEDIWAADHSILLDNISVIRSVEKYIRKIQVRNKEIKRDRKVSTAFIPIVVARSLTKKFWKSILMYGARFARFSTGAVPILIPVTILVEVIYRYLENKIKYSDFWKRFTLVNEYRNGYEMELDHEVKKFIVQNKLALVMIFKKYQRNLRNLRNTSFDNTSMVREFLSLQESWVFSERDIHLIEWLLSLLWDNIEWNFNFQQNST